MAKMLNGLGVRFEQPTRECRKVDPKVRCESAVFLTSDANS